MTHPGSRRTLRPPIGKWGGSIGGFLLILIGVSVIIQGPEALGVFIVFVACLMVLSASRTRIVFEVDTLTVYPLIGAKRTALLLDAKPDVEEITGFRKTILHSRYDVGIMTRTGFIGWTVANTLSGAEFAADTIADFLGSLPDPRAAHQD